MGGRMRAKFQVHEIGKTMWGATKATLSAVSDDGTPENQRFAKATPQGQMTINIDNPSAADFLQVGKSYYLDFSPVE